MYTPHTVMTRLNAPEYAPVFHLHISSTKRTIRAIDDQLETSKSVEFPQMKDVKGQKLREKLSAFRLQR